MSGSGSSPAVFFFTTANTVISPSIVTLALRLGVEIFQSKAQVREDGQFNFGPASNLTGHIAIPIQWNTKFVTLREPTEANDGPDRKTVE